MMIVLDPMGSIMHQLMIGAEFSSYSHRGSFFLYEWGLLSPLWGSHSWNFGTSKYKWHFRKLKTVPLSLSSVLPSFLAWPVMLWFHDVLQSLRTGNQPKIMRNWWQWNSRSSLNFLVFFFSNCSWWLKKSSSTDEQSIIFSDTNPGFLSEPIKKMDQRCKRKSSQSESNMIKSKSVVLNQPI